MRKWDRLKSGLLIGGGLYVPPFIGRLLPKVPVNRMGWYPCRDCCGCGCCACPSGASCDVQAEITGVANAACDDCTNANGTWILQWNTVLAANPSINKGCHWTVEIDSPICETRDYLALTVTQGSCSGGTSAYAITLNAALENTTGDKTLFFKSALGETPSCFFSGYDLPPFDDSCDCTTAAVCTLTAL